MSEVLETKNSDGSKSSTPEVPKLSWWDALHGLAKTGLTLKSQAGGPVAELFSAIITPPLSRRRDKWIQSIAHGLKTLEKEVEGLKIEELWGKWPSNPRPAGQA